MIIRKINDAKVKVPKLPKLDPKKVKGCDYFPEPYSNIFLVARKKSGKTSVINTIIRTCLNKCSKVYIFCSTVHKDATWKLILDYLKDRGIAVEVYTGMNEDKENVLQGILDQLNIPEEESSEEEKPKKKKTFIKWDDSDEDKPKKEYKPKRIACENMFIFDDISTELKNPALNALMKANRHYKAKVIVSTQYPLDLLPSQRKQVDYLLAFKGHPEDKLRIIHRDCDISLPFETFEQIYKHATAVPEGSKDKPFLYIDCINEKFRKSFNREYQLSN